MISSPRPQPEIQPYYLSASKSAPRPSSQGRATSEGLQFYVPGVGYADAVERLLPLAFPIDADLPSFCSQVKYSTIEGEARPEGRGRDRYCRCKQLDSLISE